MLGCEPRLQKAAAAVNLKIPEQYQTKPPRKRLEMQGEYTIYDRLGGEMGVRRLVDRFYDLMTELPAARTIRELHPDDLVETREKLFKFLSGFFGGPPLYVQEYGHPMLRARHLPFAIGADERDQWLLCMDQALDELVEDQRLVAQLKATFFRTADHMRNLPKA